MPSTFPALTAAGLGTLTFAPLPDVTPFTLRSAATYESIQYSIYAWLRDELVPYLGEHSAEATFQNAIDTLTDMVNRALGDQAATVVAALNQAVDEVVTADIPITAALFDSMGVHIAPPPSGGDDTAVLQALLLDAQATSGTLVLRAGTYRANLATNAAFVQPVLRGQGRDRTILQAYTNASPALRLKGGSGRLSGGFLSDFTILAAASGGGVGLQLADCGGVRWSRLKIDGAFDDGIQFLSEGAGGFCEFNSGDVYLKADVVQPVHYKRTSGNESFHGSGLTQGTVIEGKPTDTNPVILIDSNCFVYGAPLDITVFPSAPSIAILKNLNNGRTSSFHGHIDVESSSASSNTVFSDPTTTNGVYLQGTVSGLNGSTNMQMGNLQLVDKVYYLGTGVYVAHRPYQFAAKFTSNPLTCGTRKLSASVIHIEFRQGGNYFKQFLLHAATNPFTSGGTVNILSSVSVADTANLGNPTFSISGGVLVVTHPTLPTDGSVNVYMQVNPQNTSSGTEVIPS